MNDATSLMTRYLLGELSEREQADFEAQYFEDPRVFDELADVESALIDDYVRGRLAPATRQQFESHFMADARRRERVRFSEALTRTIDRTAPSSMPIDRPESQAQASSAGAAESWLDWLRTPGFAMAFATVLALVVVGTWLVVNTRRASEEMASGPAAEEGRGGEPAPGPSPAGVSPAPAPPEATPQPPAPVRPVLAVATLALVVGPGERSSAGNELPTLPIPPGTEQVRFALTLREHDYARYRVIVRVIGGPEVLRQGDLMPTAAGTQPTFTLTAPAARFDAGDYMLTLQGASAGDAFEDLSQTIFRVARQP